MREGHDRTSGEQKQLESGVSAVYEFLDFVRLGYSTRHAVPTSSQAADVSLRQST